MPRVRVLAISSRSSSRLRPRHVMCTTTSMPMSRLIWSAHSRVFVRVEPPAPQVIDTNPGSRPFIVRTVSNRFFSPCSVLGGKYSNENKGEFDPNSDRTVTDQVYALRKNKRDAAWRPASVDCGGLLFDSEVGESLVHGLEIATYNLCR